MIFIFQMWFKMILRKLSVKLMARINCIGFFIKQNLITFKIQLTMNSLTLSKIYENRKIVKTMLQFD